MDREQKSPYVPPKTKIITDREILKLAEANKPVTKEFNVIINLCGLVRKQVEASQMYKKEKAKDPNWDKDY